MWVWFKLQTLNLVHRTETKGSCKANSSTLVHNLHCHTPLPALRAGESGQLAKPSVPVHRHTSGPRHSMHKIGPSQLHPVLRFSELLTSSPNNRWGSRALPTQVRTASGIPCLKIFSKVPTCPPSAATALPPTSEGDARKMGR